ncbi:uncharacterized protein LOC108471827 [Gossypium arboreum]|uniref:uncharacterized protein LOC108471827 n=1 Tax=Gossypium arboreum TaxID=29729 RepID=UPI0008193F0A|nr:uncharacterized protein LOC108471827 [Gossypium arboreum]
MRPDIILQINEEVKKQFDAGFLQVIKYSKWVANIVPIPKKDGKMADALATLASMIKVSKQEDAKPIQMSICEAPSYCYNIEEEERDDHPWSQDILRYVKNREYPDQAMENDKRTLRRLAYDYALDREILYKRRKDQVLLRHVDAVEAKKNLGRSARRCLWNTR